MRFSSLRAALALGLASAVGLVCSVSWAGNDASAVQSDTAQPAVWTPKQLHFVFQGFTAKYSCQGLQDKVRKALLELGARKDLRVEEGACWRPAGGPEPFPNVNVKMSVLEPVSGGSAPLEANPVSAHWRRVDVKLDQDPLWAAGDCELLEQIKHSVLPLFATRDVDYRSSCVPHQVAPGGTWLHAQVLIPDQKDKLGAVVPK
jgi:hypothetical protein